MYPPCEMCKWGRESLLFNYSNLQTDRSIRGEGKKKETNKQTNNMSLTCPILTIEGAIVVVEVTLTTTVNDAKLEISNEQEIDCSMFELELEGKKLSEKTILVKTGITDVTELIMIHSDKAIAVRRLAEVGIKPTQRNFIQSISNGLDYIDMFLDSGLDIDGRFLVRTPLNVALRKNDIDSVTKLINRGANLTGPLLHVCRSDSYFEIAKILLQHGADVSTRKDSDNSTALHSTKSASVAKLFLDYKADVNAQDSDLCTPLHYCDGPDSAEIGRVLLEHGVDPNIVDVDGHAILHFASDPHLVKIIIQHGGDVNLRCQLGNTPLIRAVYGGRSEAAKVLLDFGADVNIVNLCGSSPLHECEDIEIASLLLKHGADINLQDSHLCTPLHFCNGPDSAAIGRVLLEHGADPNIVYTDGYAILHFASDPHLVKIIIQHGGDVNLRCQLGNTPLIKAVCGGRSEAAKVLLDFGADVNIVNLCGSSPLHECEDIEIASLLLKHGADINLQDSHLCTPLHFCNGPDSAEIGRVLLEHGADPNIVDVDGHAILHFASDPHLVKIIIQHGGDVNLRCQLGNTPLIRAVCGGRSEAAKVLLDFGADVNIVNLCGSSPLHECEDIEIASLLLKHGADINLQDSHLCTPLHFCNGPDSAEIGRVLLEHGADPNIVDVDGHAILHFASDPHLVKIIIQHGGDVNLRCQLGNTPLIRAVYGGRSEAAKVLLDFGADVNIVNLCGSSPLHECEDIEIASLLLKHGADINLQDSHLCTPLHFCNGPDSAAIGRVLLEHGADPNIVYTDGYAILHFASDPHLVKIIIQHGGDVNLRCQLGNTPLIKAVCGGRSEAAKVLLDFGADVNIVNLCGSSPLHECEGIEIASLLLKHGADINLQDSDLCTPLHYCDPHNTTIANLVEFVKLFIENGADVNIQTRDGSCLLHYILSG